MIITVIGHLCLDVIHHPDGNDTRSYGGIFFSVATLANLLSVHDTIRPVFGVGKGEYDDLILRLSSYPNVDTSGIYKFIGTTNQVHLMYSTKQERVECSKNIAEPIPIKRIRPHLAGADMILVNMISGFDITLDTLDEIRMDMREDHIPIYLDVHSLTLGIKEDFTRYHRPVEAWRRWLFMLHAVQVNEEEGAILAAEKLDEQSLAKHTLALNTKALIITRGDRGCTAFVDEHKHIHRVDIDVVDSEGAVDPTGCGDVFGAAYCTHYIRIKDVSASARFANKVAAHSAHLAGSTAIDTLSQFRMEEIVLQERTL